MERKARNRCRGIDGAQKRFNSNIKKQQRKRISLTLCKGYRKKTIDNDTYRSVEKQEGYAIDQSRK